MRRSAVMLAVGFFLTFGCDEDEFMGPDPITRIDVSLGSCAGLRVGEMCRLGVVATTQSGDRVDDPSLTWRTDDILFATVNFEGQVTGVREGTARIFVQLQPEPNYCSLQGSICDSINVQVADQPPDSEPPP